ncbi:MAG: TonB family protein [Tannerella sp.]|jgi:TonB family protein|nr:TonB family protein [Tannerella sp.]
MEPENDNDNIRAWTVSIVIHVVALIVLYLTVLSTIVPDEDSGILVNFGESFASVGTYEPRNTTTVQQKEIPPPQPQPKSKTTDEKLLTQDQEETVAIPDKKKKETEDKIVKENVRKEEEERRRAEAERLRRQQEQRQQQENISNLADKAFGQGSTQEAQQGDQQEGSGNQGSPFGNSDTGANTGTGGFGSFNLNGRSLGSGGLPRPDFNSQQEGKIVINITVDPNGNVTNAVIGRGTNIDDSRLRKSALDAARRAKFNKIQGTNNQNGTITYNYRFVQ